MAYQKCTCGNDTFREDSLAEVYQHNVMLMTSGDIDYDNAGLVGTHDGGPSQEVELVCDECQAIYMIKEGVLTSTTPAVSEKKLVITVNTNDENASNTADYAVVVLDAHSIERIKKLAATVQNLKVYNISEFNYDCDFMVEDWDVEPLDGKPPMKEFEEQMECTTLNVTDDDFFWSGYYKHTNIGWATISVPLVELDKSSDFDSRETCDEVESAGI